MNRFYDLNILLQWILGMLMGSLGLLVIIFFYDLIDVSYWFAFSIFLIVPIAQFLITPMMRLVGAYRYLSPMLLVFAARKTRYDLHNGTSFDYLFNFSLSKKKQNFQNTMLVFYLDGLLEIIRRVEAREVPEKIVVRGSSYFFSEKTANRFGFEINETGIGEKLNLLVNYLDLIWMYSLSKGRLTFPDLRDIKTATTNGTNLLAKKGTITSTREFLKRNMHE